MRITKGDINKVIVNNQYVTFYEFKIFREDVELKTISKRYSEIDELHQVCLLVALGSQKVDE